MSVELATEIRDNLPIALKAYLEHIEKKIGHKVSHDFGTLNARDIRRYAVAIDDDNALYHDSDAARQAGYVDLLAPPNMLSAIVDWGAGTFRKDLDPDGTPKAAGEQLIRKDLKVMGAGEQMQICRPVTAGTRLLCEEEITSVELKQGRSGYLIFTTYRHVFRDAEGNVLNDNHRTILVREQ